MADIPVGVQIGAELVAQTSRFENQVRAITKKINPIKLEINAGKFPLGRITGQFNEFNKSLDASVARVTAFGATAAVLFSIQRAFSGLVRTIIDVEKSLTDINVILGLSGSSLSKFGDDLFDIAKITRQSFATVAEAAKEFSRQGLSVAETLERTKAALILVNLSSLDAASSVKAITTALNSFDKEALNAFDIVNKLATVDAAFAVSSRDLAESLSRVGSSAVDASVDLDQLLAVVTAVQQTTGRGGAVIGNAFKTIFTRIGRPETLDTLEDLNVQVRDLQGNVLPTIDILSKLAQTYDSLSSSQRSQVDQLTAGVFQINVFKAAISDLGKEFSIYQRALDTSVESTDAAIKRNEALNLTLKAQLNTTLQSLTQAGNKVGNLAIRPVITNLVGAGGSLGDLVTKQLTGEGVGGEIGKNIAEGILKGIGNVLSGPGLLLAATLVFKLFKVVIGDSIKATQALLQVGNASEGRRKIEERVAALLSLQNSEIQAMVNGQTTIEGKAAAILALERGITADYEKRVALARSLATILASQGVRPNQIGALTPKANKADGHIPNFNAFEKEKVAIRQGVGGARPDRAKPVLKYINMAGGRTPVVVNTDETIVRNWMDSGKDAVINPNMERNFGGGLERFGRVEHLAKGTPSNLDNFLKDSKIKSRLYHGTISPDFNTFDLNQPKLHGGSYYTDPKPVIFLTKSPNTADVYARNSKGLYQAGSSILPLYANLKNPIDFSKDKYWNIASEAKKREYAQQRLAKDPTIDGIINNNGYVMVFSPNQIKSAIGNRGTFDPNNPDITAAKGYIPNYNIRYPNLPKEGEQFMPGMFGDLNWKNFIRMVPPENFLKLATPLNQPKEHSLLDIEDRIKKGGPLDPPILYLANKEGLERPLVFGHEGRHRATVSKQLGIKKIPVAFNIYNTKLPRVPKFTKADWEYILKGGFYSEQAYTALQKGDRGFANMLPFNPFNKASGLIPNYTNPSLSLSEKQKEELLLKLHGKKFGLDKTNMARHMHALGKATSRLTPADQSALVNFLQGGTFDKNNILDIKESNSAGEYELNQLVPTKTPGKSIQTVLAVHPDKLDKVGLVTVKNVMSKSLAKGHIPSYARQLIGQGAFRRVYSTNDPSKVLSELQTFDEVRTNLSRTPLRYIYTEEDYKREYLKDKLRRPMLQKKLGDLGLGPKVYSIDATTGNFKAERINEPTLYDALDTDKITDKEAWKRRSAAIKKFTKAMGFEPTDINLKNVTTSGKILDFAGGHIPNLARIPIVSPLLGRIATNLIAPRGYSLNSKIDDIKAKGLKSSLQAILKDKPIYEEWMHEDTSTYIRELAYRRMFGLKPRVSQEKLDQLLEKTGKDQYAFRKGTPAHDTIIDDVSKIGDYKPSYIQEGHPVMAGYTIHPKTAGFEYKDVWDVALNKKEAKDTSIRSIIKGVRKQFYLNEDNYPRKEKLHKKILRAFDDYLYNAEDKHGGSYGQSPPSNLLRKAVGLFTSPVTFKGVISPEDSEEVGDALRRVNVAKRWQEGDRGLQIARGYVPNMATRYGLGYAKFKPNLFGLKDLLKDPKGTLGRLPFRIAGSIGAGLVGAGIKRLGKEPLEAEPFFGVARYLSGIGGVKSLSLKTQDIERALRIKHAKGISTEGFLKLRDIKQEDKDDVNSYYNRTKTVTGSGKSPLFNLIGDYRLASKPGVLIQDAFDFDHSASKIDKTSLAFDKGFDFRKFSKGFSKLDDFLYKKSIKYRKGKLYRKLYDRLSSFNVGPLNLNLPVQRIRGLDLEFAKYGSPFLTRIKHQEADGLVPNFGARLDPTLLRKINLREPETKAALLKQYGFTEEDLKLLGPNESVALRRMVGAEGVYSRAVPNYAKSLPALLHQTQSVGAIKRDGIVPRRKNSLESAPRDIQNVEKLFEEVRKREFPSLPSRLDSVFLSHKKRPFFSWQNTGVLAKVNPKSYLFDVKYFDAAIQHGDNRDAVIEEARRYYGTAQPLTRKALAQTIKNSGKMSHLRHEVLNPGVIEPSNILARGLVPNFSPLSLAIGREAQFVPRSQIYVDQDSRLKSASNPAGLLVANKRDEPLGGFQGVNRALAEGRNPKTYGVPNYGLNIKRLQKEYKYDPRFSLRNSETGSFLDFDKDKEKISIDFIASNKKGDARQLFQRLFKIAQKRKLPIMSESLVGQDVKIPPSDKLEHFYQVYPPLKYRKGLGKTSGMMIDHRSSGVLAEFKSIEELEEKIKTLPLGPHDVFFKNLKTAARGHIPNFARDIPPDLQKFARQLGVPEYLNFETSKLRDVAARLGINDPSIIRGTATDTQILDSILKAESANKLGVGKKVGTRGSVNFGPIQTGISLPGRKIVPGTRQIVDPLGNAVQSSNIGSQVGVRGTSTAGHFEVVDPLLALPSVQNQSRDIKFASPAASAVRKDAEAKVEAARNTRQQAAIDTQQAHAEEVFGLANVRFGRQIKKRSIFSDEGEHNQLLKAKLNLLQLTSNAQGTPFTTIGKVEPSVLKDVGKQLKNTMAGNLTAVQDHIKGLQQANISLGRINILKKHDINRLINSADINEKNLSKIIVKRRREALAELNRENEAAARQLGKEFVPLTLGQLRKAPRGGSDRFAELTEGAKAVTNAEAIARIPNVVVPPTFGQKFLDFRNRSPITKFFTAFDTNLSTEEKQKRRQERAGKLTGLGFAASFLGPAIASGLGASEKTQKLVGGVTAGIGTAAFLASAGPVGATIGVAIGSFQALSAVAASLTPSFEELAQASAELGEKQQAQLNSIGGFQKAESDLQEIVKGGNKQAIGRGQINLQKALNQLDPTVRSRGFVGASFKEREQLIFDRQEELNKIQAQSNFNALLAKVDDESTLGISNRSQRRVAEFAKNINTDFLPTTIPRKLTGLLTGGISDLLGLKEDTRKEFEKSIPTSLVDIFKNVIEPFKAQTASDKLIDPLAQDFFEFSKDAFRKIDPKLKNQGTEFQRVFNEQLTKQLDLQPGLKGAIGEKGDINFTAFQEKVLKAVNLDKNTTNLQDAISKSAIALGNFAKIVERAGKSLTFKNELTNLKESGGRQLGLARAGGQFNAISDFLTDNQRIRTEAEFKRTEILSENKDATNQIISSFTKSIPNIIKDLELSQPGAQALIGPLLTGIKPETFFEDTQKLLEFQFKDKNGIFKNLKDISSASEKQIRESRDSIAEELTLQKAKTDIRIAIEVEQEKQNQLLKTGIENAKRFFGGLEAFADPIKRVQTINAIQGGLGIESRNRRESFDTLGNRARRNQFAPTDLGEIGFQRSERARRAGQAREGLPALAEFKTQFPGFEFLADKLFPTLRGGLTQGISDDLTQSIEGLAKTALQAFQQTESFQLRGSTFQQQVPDLINRGKFLEASDLIGQQEAIKPEDRTALSDFANKLKAFDTLQFNAPKAATTQAAQILGIGAPTGITSQLKDIQNSANQFLGVFGAAEKAALAQGDVVKDVVTAAQELQAAREAQAKADAAVTKEDKEKFNTEANTHLKNIETILKVQAGLIGKDSKAVTDAGLVGGDFKGRLPHFARGRLSVVNTGETIIRPRNSGLLKTLGEEKRAVPSEDPYVTLLNDSDIVVPKGKDIKRFLGLKPRRYTDGQANIDLKNPADGKLTVDLVLKNIDQLNRSIGLLTTTIEKLNRSLGGEGLGGRRSIGLRDYATKTTVGTTTIDSGPVPIDPKTGKVILKSDEQLKEAQGLYAQYNQQVKTNPTDTTGLAIIKQHAMVAANKYYESKAAEQTLTTGKPVTAQELTAKETEDRRQRQSANRPQLKSQYFLPDGQVASIRATKYIEDPKLRFNPNITTGFNTEKEIEPYKQAFSQKAFPRPTILDPSLIPFTKSINPNLSNILTEPTFDKRISNIDYNFGQMPFDLAQYKSSLQKIESQPQNLQQGDLIKYNDLRRGAERSLNQYTRQAESSGGIDQNESRVIEEFTRLLESFRQFIENLAKTKDQVAEQSAPKASMDANVKVEFAGTIGVDNKGAPKSEEVETLTKNLMKIQDEIMKMYGAIGMQKPPPETFVVPNRGAPDITIVGSTR